MNDAVCDSSSPALTGEQSAHTEEIAQMRLDYSTDQRVWDLLAEVERLRKIENDALWLARLACSSSWPMDMAQQVENAAERVKAAFSGSSGGEG